MKILSESEVKKIVEDHELWLKTGGEKGKRAFFVASALSGLDFHGRNLQNARFGALNLRNMNFRNANLRGAVFFYSRLINADFRGADLTDADFDDTDTGGMIYDETTIPAMVCPKEGSFIGYKKAFSVISEDEFIVKLWIPADAKRSSATGNKCRCNKAEVLSITNLDGTETDVTVVRSRCRPSFLYRPGETVEVSDFDFDECRWHECAPGIHFFMFREDAVKW